MAKTEVLELKAITPKTATITIEGDSDLVLNKMNDRARRVLSNPDAPPDVNVPKKPNKWEDIITAVHWLGGAPSDFTEKTLSEKLKKDAPCITAFGLKQSFKQAVTRNKVSQYSTEFDATINVVGKGDGLIPIKFTEHHVDEKLMSPKRGAPVHVYLNRFSGWKAEITVSYLENVYSLEQIVNIVNLAGFGLGIGSGRTSGYGRYHVVDVK